MGGSGTGTLATAPVIPSTGSYNRFRLREEVRRIIRDPDFPKRDIDRAINSVISTINLIGRFKFHQGYYDVTLVESQKAYNIPDLISEELVVFAPDSEDEKILTKSSDLIDPYARGWFSEEGDAPSHFLFWGGQIWFNPLPSATAAGKTVRVLGFYRLSLIEDDTTLITLNDSYALSVLAWGAAAEVNPNLVIESSGKQNSIRDIYQLNLKSMVRSELWEPMISHNFLRDNRWNNISSMGHVGRVRG